MQEVYLCLDVGGTEIKAAPLDKRGNFLAPVRHFPAMAGADRQTLLENFGWIFSSICPENAVPIEIDLAFPGPFDYKNGICLLQGLDKYDALYGCNLRRAFSEISGLPEQRIQFINDAAAFALGEMAFGQATQAGRALFVAVGTGCGSAFGVNGFLAEEGTPGVPPNGYFYNAPFRDSCVDDYISRRGLEKLSGEMLGVPLDGRALAERIAAGDYAAALAGSAVAGFLALAEEFFVGHVRLIGMVGLHVLDVVVVVRNANQHFCRLTEIFFCLT